jgi:hypothetical protein
MPGFKGKRKRELTLTLYKKPFRYRLPVSPPRKRTKTSSSTPNLKSPSIRTNAKIDSLLIYLDFNLLLPNRNLSPITFKLPRWKNIENLTCIFVKNNLEMCHNFRHVTISEGHNCIICSALESVEKSIYSPPLYTRLVIRTSRTIGSGVTLHIQQ